MLGAVAEPAVDGAHTKHHTGLAVPAVVLALEEVVEEPVLQTDAVVGVELGPVLEAVDLEPLLFGGRLHERLDVASEVQ